MLERFNQKRDEGKMIEKEGRSQIKWENEMKNNGDASTRALYPDLCFVSFNFFFFFYIRCVFLDSSSLFCFLNYKL